MSSSSRFQLPYASVFDAAGVPLPGAKLNFYISETDTRQDTFTGPTLGVANANPVVALDNGLFPNIFLTPGALYKVVLTDSTGAEIWTADPVADAGSYYPVTFEILGGLPDEATPILGLHPFPVAVTFPANFSGWAAYAGTPPAATYTIAIKRRTGSAVGTMIIATDGSFSFSTVSGLPAVYAANDVMILAGTGANDTTLADFAWTLPGVVSA